MRLDATLAERNLAANSFDLALRKANVGSMSGAVKLFDETMQPVCSPRLLSELSPVLRTPADLARHTASLAMPKRLPPLLPGKVWRRGGDRWWTVY